MIMKHIPIGTQEIDWYKNYKVFALNLSTFIYENVSGFDESEKCIIHLVSNFDNVEENDISVEMRKIIFNKINKEDKDVLFALYNCPTYLVGYVTTNDSLA